MDHAHEILMLLAQSVVFVVGFLGNLFIVVWHLMEWRKKQSMSSCELLVSSLGICNILFQCFSYLISICTLILTDFYSNNKVAFPLLFIGLYLLSSSLWFSTCLCADYCLRIINSNWRLFVWLKITVTKRGPWLIFGTKMISLSTSLPAIFDFQFIKNINSTELDLILKNQSKVTGLLISNCSCFFTVYIYSTSLAFVIFFCAAITILTSLYKHIRRMGRNSETFGTPRLVAHFGAAKTVTSLLLLYIALYTIQFFIFSDMASPGQKWFVLCVLAASLFPALISAVLINGNSYLRNDFSVIVGHIINYRRQSS